MVTNPVEATELKIGHFMFRLPYFKKFAAMTINPYIYINPKIVNPDQVPILLVAHENIHIKQQEEVGLFLWYLAKYCWKWFKNLFKYGFSMDAYYAIDWEVEAYCEATPGYLTYIGLKELEDAYNESKS
jgi:hypothetical protein